MDYVIKEAKTIEEALKEALIDLNVDKEDVDVEVLQEPTKGFLGLIGGKDAKIKVTINRDLEILANEFMDQVLTSIGIDGDIRIEKNKDLLEVKIENVDPNKKGIIIGKRGSTLDSIQYLLNLTINKNSKSYIKVLVDVGNYRDKRRETLEKLAVRMAEKSSYINKPVKLEPMNAYERKIIHSALQDEKNVTTYSEGNEPYRRVVIKYKDY